MLVLAVSMTIAGCSSTDKNEDNVTERVVATDFILEVTTPTVLSTGETLKVKGTLKYTGIKPVEVTHGKPIIRFSFSGSNEQRNYADVGYVTEFKLGQVVEVEDEFIVTKKGKQNLIVDMTADISMTMNPIEIVVK
ncbi:hypothetical protein BK141_24100 [Paenibacillus sp. FSL R5-0765]|uniref:hypothetical protein n=2 Tax=unclassified Paenibacillus TaxID=185978 RepID=UPI00096C1545|nr:hypothetical protein [Paenibacillus sp. FSL R5-0765]OMF59944.1 hypothetical protein BK141_24100 [Paenibacillus sp. FSL R5-0765]